MILSQNLSSPTLHHPKNSLMKATAEVQSASKRKHFGTSSGPPVSKRRIVDYETSKLNDNHLNLSDDIDVIEVHVGKTRSFKTEHVAPEIIVILDDESEDNKENGDEMPFVKNENKEPTLKNLLKPSNPNLLFSKLFQKFLATFLKKNSNLLTIFQIRSNKNLML